MTQELQVIATAVLVGFTLGIFLCCIVIAAADYPPRERGHPHD